MSKLFLVPAAGALLLAICGAPCSEASQPAARHHGSRNSASHDPLRRGRPQAITAASAVALDINNGRTLFARNENELRQPASITKVMTLYLLFEQLERGCLRLDTRLQVSHHAASQPPSKMGLQAGQTIDVATAIEAVVTKSANDAAVAIAEKIGGDEESFARLMTSEAHALGMTHTHFENASGLPDTGQLTTARDLAVLGNVIEDRFPAYFGYFAIRKFTYRGHIYRNHNRLLGRINGMDGIKTGFVRASGYNLLASIKRNGRRLVAVILGGRTASARDQAMIRLIESSMGKASSVRTVTAFVPPSSSRGQACKESGDREEPAVMPSNPPTTLKP